MAYDMKSYGKTLNSTQAEKLIKSRSSDYNQEIKDLMAAHGIVNIRANNQMYSKFSRIPIIDPYNNMTVTREYLFFTKPDLHLINTTNGKIANSLQYYSFFNDAIDRYKPVCEQLQISTRGINPRYTASGQRIRSPFINLLSNTVQSELELPDIESSNDQETGANVYGTKIYYRGNSYPSDQDCSFSLEFEDTKYLEVYMFFKIYDEYCRYKNMGLIDFDYEDRSDNDDERWINYVKNKVLHDQFSVYKFVVGEDGMTLIYWAKYTGVYPTGVPRSALSSMNNNEGQKLTVNFKAQFIRDMDPIILSDFNNVALNSGTFNNGDLPLFNTDSHHMEGDWASMPYIATVKYNDETLTDKMTRYRLLWKR